MAFPRKLKTMNLFNEGLSYMGETGAVTLPKLGRNFEEWRGGGMDAAVKVDMGGTPLEMEWSTGGPMRDVLRQFGVTTLGGVYLRFAGAYQNDQTGTIDAIEVTVRGRHEEIDMGEQKVGEGGEFKVKSALVYFRLDWNGVEEVEIDILNSVFRVGGIDRLAGLRAAIG